MSNSPTSSELIPAPPNPSEAGSSGTQVLGTAEPIPNVSEGLPSPIRPIAETVHFLTDIRGRAADQALRIMCAALLAERDRDKDSLENKLSEERDAHNYTREELSKQRAEGSKLQERVDSLLRERRTGNICILLGTALLGIGIDQARGTGPSLGWLLILIGIVLVISGWTFEGRDK